MQINSLYLYPNKIDLFTSSLASWTTERYRQVYNRNLKIFRSVDNRVDLQIKNSDQKPISTTGATLVFNLLSREGQDLVWSKDCEEVDSARGRYRIHLTSDELIDLESGFYNYSFVQETRTDIDSTNHKVIKRTPLYTDSQYDVIGTLEIQGDVLGEVQDSLVVNKFSYTNPFTVGETTVPYYVSSIIDAQPNINIPQSLHTLVFYSSDYEGTVTIQGSIREDAAPSIWTNITTFQITEPVMYKNITGKYRWFRIKHEPATVTSIAEFVIAQTLLGNYDVSIRSPGAGYQYGDVITILGRDLGGESGTNDLTITVTNVNAQGSISSFNHSGISYNGVKTFVLRGSTPEQGKLDKILYR